MNSKPVVIPPEVEEHIFVVKNMIVNDERSSSSHSDCSNEEGEEVKVAIKKEKVRTMQEPRREESKT